MLNQTLSPETQENQIHLEELLTHLPTDKTLGQSKDVKNNQDNREVDHSLGTTTVNSLFNRDILHNNKSTGLRNDEANTKHGLHFCPQPTYLVQICILLAIAYAPLVYFLNSLTVIMFLSSIIIYYIFDFTNRKNEALLVCIGTTFLIWISMISHCISELNISNYVTDSSYSYLPLVTNIRFIFLVSVISMLLLLTMIFTALQFRFVHQRSPDLTILFERLVMSLLPIASLPSLVLIAHLLFDVQLAYPLLSVSLCIIHSYFYTVHHSSYVATFNPKFSSVCFITEKAEAQFYTLVIVTLPPLLYSVSHCYFSTSGVTIAGMGDIALHVVHVCCLISIPLCYVSFHPTQSLWWLHIDIKQANRCKERKAMQNTLILEHISVYVPPISYVCITASLSMRLIEYCRGYLFMHYRYGVNCLGLWASFVLLGISLHNLNKLLKKGRLFNTEASPLGFIDDIQDQVRIYKPEVVLKVLLPLGLSCIIVAILIHMSPFVVLINYLAMSSMASYLIEPDLLSFLSFLFLSVLAFAWWLFESFSFIRVPLFVLGEHQISVENLGASVLWAYILICLSFAGFIIQHTTLSIGALVLYIMQLIWLEHVLYTQSSTSSYPIYFLALTSALGGYVCHHLYRRSIISHTVYALLSSLFYAKLVLWFYDKTVVGYILGLDNTTGLSIAYLYKYEITAILCSSVLLIMSIFLPSKSNMFRIRCLVLTFIISFCMRHALVKYLLDSLFYDIEHGIVEVLLGTLLLWIVQLSAIIIVIPSTSPCFSHNHKQIMAVVFILSFFVLLNFHAITELYYTTTLQLFVYNFLVLLSGCLLLPLRVVCNMTLGTIYKHLFILGWHVLLCTGLTYSINPFAHLVQFLSIFLFIILVSTVIYVAYYIPNNTTTSDTAAVFYPLHIPYLLSIVFFFLAIFTIKYSNIDHGTSDIATIDLYDAVDGSLCHLMILGFMLYLTLAIILRVRVSTSAFGHALSQFLLPNSLSLSFDYKSDISTLCNFSVILSYMLYVVYIVHDAMYSQDPVPIILVAPVFYLIIPDSSLFAAFDRRRRHLCVFAAASVPLWLQWGHSLATHSQLGAADFLQPLAAAPGQAALLAQLHRSPGHSGRFAPFCALDLAALLLATSPNIRWIAALSLVTHATVHIARGVRSNAGRVLEQL